MGGPEWRRCARAAAVPHRSAVGHRPQRRDRVAGIISAFSLRKSRLHHIVSHILTQKEQAGKDRETLKQARPEVECTERLHCNSKV
jgi:hypothetical protein